MASMAVPSCSWRGDRFGAAKVLAAVVLEELVKKCSQEIGSSILFREIPTWLLAKFWYCRPITPGVSTPPARLTGMMVTARVADSGLCGAVP